MSKPHNTKNMAVRRPARSDGAPSPVRSDTTANLVPTIARTLLGLAEERGVSPDRLCRGLGFTYADLARQDVLLSYQQTRSLIQRAERMLGVPVLGLAVGARETPVSWGLAGLAMLTCETFGEAITYIVSYQDATGTMVEQMIGENGREMYLDIRPHRFDLQLEPFLVEETFASAVGVTRQLVSQSFNPLRIDLNYQCPGDEEVYRHFFRCPVRFGAGVNRMTFEPHWFGVRMPGYDRLMCHMLREQLSALIRVPQGRADLIESVSNSIRVDVKERSTQRKFAQAINVSERTLRRHLSKEDVTYRGLRDETRYEQARDLLANSAMTIDQVAEAVGYSDARAFRRAFKRWSGHLPADYRKATRQGR